MTYEDIKYKIESGYYDVSEDNIDLSNYIDDPQSRHLRFDLSGVHIRLNRLFQQDLNNYIDTFNQLHNTRYRCATLVQHGIFTHTKLELLNAIRDRMRIRYEKQRLQCI